MSVTVFQSHVWKLQLLRSPNQDMRLSDGPGRGLVHVERAAIADASRLPLSEA